MSCLFAGHPPLEMWAGVECTVNRVGQEYRDQLARSGHAARGDDLDRFAALGIRSLRYPVLWSARNQTQTRSRTGPGRMSGWATCEPCASRRLSGCVHHGSGPRDTSLVDSGTLPTG